MPSIALAKPYIPYTAPYVAPAPTPPYVGQIQPYTPPTVDTHVSGGECGCGSTHAVDAASSPVSGTTVPAFLSAGKFNLDTPAGFKLPESTPMDFLSKINWQEDWWKFAAGALAYRLFVAK